MNSTRGNMNSFQLFEKKKYNGYVLLVNYNWVSHFLVTCLRNSFTDIAIARWQQLTQHFFNFETIDIVSSEKHIILLTFTIECFRILKIYLYYVMHINFL